MAARKKLTPARAGPRKAPPTTAVPTRRDLGAPTGPYYAAQPREKRVLLEKLRALVDKAVPDAKSSIKWGVPFYTRGGKSLCAIAAFKEHVAITFFASPSVLADPGRKLEGGSKSMRMLKVRTEKDIDAASIRRWLRAIVAANGEKEDEVPPKSKPSPSRSGRGTDPPGGGYGKGGKKRNAPKAKPGR